MKGENGMCEHGRLKTVGDRLFCKDCGQELPLEFLVADNGKNGAKKPAEDAKTDKASPRKRTAKKAE